MRLMKFRAYDKQKKEMIYDPIEYDLRMLKAREISPPYIIGFDPRYDGQIFEVMEWASFKDNKKNDIYEGDYLKVVYMNKEIYEGVVIFDEGSFSLKIENIVKGSSKKSRFHNFDIGSTPALYNFEYFEIIGNIYEGKYEK